MSDSTVKFGNASRCDKRNKVKLVSAVSAGLSLLSTSAWAASGTWLNTGNTNGNWNTSNNWTGGTIPGATSGTADASIATFNTAVGTYGTSGSPIVIDANRNIAGITYNATAAGAYFIGSTGGNSLLLSSAGTIQMTNVAITNNQTINAPLVLEGATYAFTNNGTSTGTLNVGGAISGVTAGTVLTLNGTHTGANTVSGNISDGSSPSTVGIFKDQAGVWVLSGNNTYSGSTTLNQGTLRLLGTASNGGTTDAGTNTSLSASSALTLNSGATLDLRSDVNNTFAAASIATNGTATRTVTINVDRSGASATNKTLSLTGAITAGGGGVNTFNVTGANGYALSLGSITLNSAGGSTITLNPTTANLTVASISLGNGTSTANVAFTGSGNTTVTGVIANAGGKSNAVNFNQTGTVTLNGTNTISNTFSLNSGTVIANNNSAINGAVNLGNTTASSTAAATLLLGGTDTSGLTGGITMSKAISAKDTTSGTLTVGGQNTSGTNTFSGAITLGSTTNTGKNVILVAATGGTVNFGQIAVNGTGATTPGGITVGNASNTGTVSLTNANNTYNGDTTVANGTLKLTNTTTNNNISASPNITIASGATLDVSGLGTGGNAAKLNLATQTLKASGSGTATFTGSLNAGAQTVNLSADPANLTTLAISNGLTLGGSTLNFDLGNNSLTNDKITSGAAATLTGTNTINIAAITGATSLALGQYTLLTATSGLNTGGTFAIGNTNSKILVNGHNYKLTLTNSATSELLTVANALTQTFAKTATDPVNAFVGTSGIALGNLSASGSTLNVSLGTTGGITAAASAGNVATVADGSTVAITGTASNTAGSAQAYSVSNTDSNASPATASITGTINTYDHANASFSTASDASTSTVHLGRFTQGQASASSGAYALGNRLGSSGLRDGLDVTSLTANGAGSAGSGTFASGGSTFTNSAAANSGFTGYTASISGNTGGQLSSKTFTFATQDTDNFNNARQTGSVALTVDATVDAVVTHDTNTAAGSTYDYRHGLANASNTSVTIDRGAPGSYVASNVAVSPAASIGTLQINVTGNGTSGFGGDPSVVLIDFNGLNSSDANAAAAHTALTNLEADLSSVSFVDLSSSGYATSALNVYRTVLGKNYDLELIFNPGPNSTPSVFTYDFSNYVAANGSLGSVANLAVVPEPASLGVLAVGTAGLLARRRRVRLK